MLEVLSYILCDLDPKVKVMGQKAGICDGVLSTSALVKIKKLDGDYKYFSLILRTWICFRKFLKC